MRHILQNIIILFSVSVFAQGETTQWYFGKNAGLDFLTDPPGILTGSMNTAEGCSSIADEDGNMLFYTDGVSAWNSLHQVMANGSMLTGHNSSAQSSLIVKKPGSPSLYYLFTVWPFSGFHYSIVDMSLAAGLGSVTAVKNQLLQSSVTEQMTAVRHCNSTDVWVMVHEGNSSNFCAYLVTPAGVSTVPVISSVGPFHPGGSTGQATSLKFSPNGKMLAASLKDSLFIFDFDASTGIVSNPRKLGTGLGGIYIPEFSPDGTKLYAAKGPVFARLYQWNLCAGNDSAIAASQATVYTATSNTVSINALQLASNGKIYLAWWDSLGVIHNPNGVGPACNFSLAGQTLLPNQSRAGLPGFICSLFLQSAPPFSYTLDCLEGAFLAAPPYGINPACAASNYTVSGILWNFGDPGSGSANTTTLTNPSHVFTAPGTYHVKLAYITACGVDTLKKKIVVGGPPQFTVQVPAPLCAGQQVTVTTQGQDSLLWFDAATAPVPIASGSVLITPTLAAGTYTYYLARPGCALNTARMPFTLQLHPQPVVAISPAQPTVCAGNAISLLASGATAFQWAHGPQVAAITLTPANTATYTVTGSNQAGCSHTAAVTVSVSTCTGLFETVHSQLSIKTYPNPARRVLTIESATSQKITILNSLGQLLYEILLDKGLNDVDVSQLQADTYYLYPAGSREAIKILLE